MTPQNLTFLNAWARAEGGGASNNPFNTTQRAAGASSYNSVGVRNYASPLQGIQATDQTLLNGRYGNILAALRQGQNARLAAQALANSPWGTGSLVERILGGSPAGSPPVTAPPVAPQAAPARQGLTPDLAALFNRGNEMFGLAPLPANLLQSPAPAPQPRGQAAASPKQQILHSETIGKFHAPVVDLTSVGGEHQTEGLPGYPAHDFFAPSGSPVVAPVTGRVVKLSGHDPAEGPVEGPHGPLGWSVYIEAPDGHTYYLTHLGSRSVHLGQTIKAGQRIGSVADYAKYGTPSHVHMGVH